MDSNDIRKFIIKDKYENNGYKEFKLLCYNHIDNKFKKDGSKEIIIKKTDKFYKTKLCTFYKKFKRCNNGNHCRFAHDLDEIKEIKSNNKLKKELFEKSPSSFQKEKDLYIYNNNSMYDNISYSFDTNRKNDEKKEQNNFNINLIVDGNVIKNNDILSILNNPILEKENKDLIYELILKMENDINIYICKIKKNINNIELIFQLNKIKMEIYLFKKNYEDIKYITNKN